MEQLTAHCQHYPWGSTTLIAGLRGEPGSAQPEAELWYGAHPGLPSTLRGGQGLDEAIAARPQETLGQEVAGTYGRLPFLLKILAAGKPLSLQAHPSKTQAEEGFARENAAGIPLAAPHRMYKDDNHKPELVVALSRFHAMAGFRPIEQTVELLTLLGTPALCHAAQELTAGPAALEMVLHTWLGAADPGALVAETLAAVAQARAQAGLPEWVEHTLSNLALLAEHYPGDVGIMGALLLNFIILEPGEAMFLEAGNLHAYCQGLAVEIMANSDNVLRGGLTSKHIDVAELMTVLRFDTIDNPKVYQSADGEYQLPTAEFRLHRVAVGADPQAVTVTGPRIVVCTEGSATVRSAGHAVRIGPTEALWLGNNEPARLEVSSSGGAVLFIASV